MAIEHLTIHVAELDCADEVLQLRKAFEDCRGIQQLGFDILNGRMRVVCDVDEISKEEILHRITRLGMHGRWWSPNERAATTSTVGILDRRVLVTVASGVMLVVAFGLHLFLSDGSESPFEFSLDQTEVTIPFIVQACYALSVILGAWLVAPRAWASIRHFRADMNLLMCVAVGGAIALGQWLEAAVVTFLFAVSLLLEQWSLGRARQAIASLMGASPQQSRCIGPDGEITEKDTADVRPGELLVVRPGEKIALDGVVRNGRSTVDQAPITGESVAVAKEVG